MQPDHLADDVDEPATVRPLEDVLTAEPEREDLRR
jgi:hypothetical protein